MYTKVGNVGGRLRRDQLNTVLRYTAFGNGINRPSSEALLVPLAKLFWGKVLLFRHSCNSLFRLWKWHICFQSFFFLKNKPYFTLYLFLIDRLADCWRGVECGRVHHRVDVEIRSKFSSSTIWVLGGQLGQAWWPLPLPVEPSSFWTFKVSLYMN